MRRKPGALLSIEVAILQAAMALFGSAEPDFYGYAIAKELRDQEAARRLTAHGTLYRALERLEKLGLLSCRWEDPAVAASEQRPLRRLYRITAAGELALAEAAPAPAASKTRRTLEKGLSPS